MLISLSCAVGHAATPTFQHDVLPLFEKRCAGCHGAKPSAGLDVRDLASVMKGGASGKAIEPGKPESSLLWTKIDSGAMPMGGAPLTADEKNLVRTWIEQGQFPLSITASAADSPESRINDQARKFWSYQRPVKKPAPQVKHAEQVRTPIDRFILEKLEAQAMAMNPEASREKLIRRAYFDLTGMPPTPEKVAAFVRDKSANGYEALIDSLLASPHYGERWARHWLDVGGYADSNGYLGDEPRTLAWQYRDWVVRSFNKDLPYNEFLMLQLAGDQIAQWRMGEKLSPDAVDKLTATGFLRLTPDATDNQPIYEIDKQYDALHAATEVSMKAVMGTNINCARCHDHKFDPILQKDYYRIMALFRPVYDPDDTFPKPKGESHWLPANLGYGGWPSRFVPNATQSELEKYIEAANQISATRKKATRQLALMYGKARDRWRQTQYAKLEEPLRTQLLEASRVEPKDRNEAHNKLIKEYSAKYHIEDEDLGAVDADIAKLEAVQKAEDEKLRDVKPPMIWAAWDASPRAETRLLKRGNFDAPGEMIQPGVPLIFDDAQNPFRIPDPPEGSNGTGRRLAFAKWLTRPDHPLTARVMVNRVWQYHFGTGLVASPDDFGSQGARPTHPELLDWLAVSFVEHGWSLKWLHREIMLSSVYRQSSLVDKAKYEKDPTDKLLGRWPTQRLDSESIRDAILSVSGQINLKVGGEPISLCTLPDGSYYPDTLGRIDNLVDGRTRFFPPACDKSTPKPVDDDHDPNRRTLYIQARRTYVVGFLGAFDAPLMETNASTRFATAAPRQSLSALHNPLALGAAEKLAALTKADAGADMVARIRRAIERTYARPATEAEISFGFGEIRKQKDPEFGLRLFCQALLGSSEFLFVD